MRADGAFHVEHSRRAAEGRVTSVLGSTNGRPNGVTDHIVPHRGDRKLFESKSNLQSLCTECHNRKSQSER
jgi:5-methylcytosine-specific restriction endonuclease McrA